MITTSVGRQYTPVVISGKTAQRRWTALVGQRQDSYYSFFLHYYKFLLQGLHQDLQGFSVVGKPCNIYRLQGNPIVSIG